MIYLDDFNGFTLSGCCDAISLDIYVLLNVAVSTD